MVACVSHSSALPNLLGDLAREGVVESVDYAEGTARVRLGDLVTGDIPWLSPRAGKIRIYCPPVEGEQVLVISPEGRTASAIIAGSLSSDANPHAGADANPVIAFEGGATIGYDLAANRLTMHLPAGGTLDVEAPGGTKWTGDLDVTGKVTASDDVVGAGKSLKDHFHDKVQPGNGVTGKPV